MCIAFGFNVDEETKKIEKEFDWSRGLFRDSATLALLRLEDHIDYVLVCFK